MNKRQIEIQKQKATEEAGILKELKAMYKKASEDCANRIRELSMRDDMHNLQSIIYQKQYQEALKKQIDDVLNELNNSSFASISDYLHRCYENGFIGTLYDLQGQGIPLIFPMDQSQAVKAIQVDSKISKPLYSKLGDDVASLKDTIRSELTRGIATGKSWNQIAAEITTGMASPFGKAYNNALRIARTEGHRVQESATLDCQRKAKDKGADVLKQWDSTLDGKTRPDHVTLDGQLREIDDPFEVSGKTAMHPGAFGIASEDVNCRCTTLQRARWALTDEEFTKMNGDTGELVKIKESDLNGFTSVFIRLMQ